MNLKQRAEPQPLATGQCTRVLESPISFECKVSKTVELEGDVGPGSIIIFGRVVYMHFHDKGSPS